MPPRKRAKQQTEKRLTEQRNPGSRNLDRRSALSIVQLMNREDRKVAVAVGRALPAIARAVEEITKRMRQGGRLIYVGAGTSGRLGVLDASECPPTFGTPPELVHGVIAGGSRAVTQAVEGAEDRVAEARKDLKRLRVGRKDSVVGIAASGTTPYVLAAIAYAKKQGSLTVGISANKHSPLTRGAQIGIATDVGPEVLTGSTRLKAGTSQKMVLNMLSTAAMVKLGRAYDNLMIDMGKTNVKLKDRARRIVQAASGKSASTVEHALRQSKHDLRVALVMLKKNLNAEAARQSLVESEGNLRRALGE